MKTLRHGRRVLNATLPPDGAAIVVGGAGGGTWNLGSGCPGLRDLDGLNAVTNAGSVDVKLP